MAAGAPEWHGPATDARAALRAGQRARGPPAAGRRRGRRPASRSRSGPTRWSSSPSWSATRVRHARPLEDGQVRVHLAGPARGGRGRGRRRRRPDRARADRPPFAALSGRGLGIVDALSETWGVEGAGTDDQLVWAVVARRGTPARRPWQSDASDRDSPLRTPGDDDVPVVGGREPCPCGSGRRYKACHGRAAAGRRALVPAPVRGAGRRVRLGGAARDRPGRDGPADA